MWRRILIAIDGSDASQHALEHVIEFSAANNGTLTLIAVAPHAPVFVANAGIDPGILDEANQKEAEANLRAAEALVPDSVSVTTQVRRGNAGPEIVAAAAEHDVELIAMGSRGLGRAQSVFLSVGAYVHFHSDLPLLVVKAPEDGEG